MDEYMWSPQSIDLKEVLKIMKHCSQIQVSHTIFGSNGHISQPSSVVEGFTKRSTVQAAEGNFKYFINTDFKFSSLNCHHATFVDETTANPTFFQFNLPYFVLNHYCCQSLEFWRNVKCTRGDGDGYRQRTEEDFKQYDQNEVEDTDLFEQNKKIIRTTPRLAEIDKIFVINLDQRPDRLDDFLEEFKKMRFPDDKPLLERFPGILDEAEIGQG
jgi:hypothetical protein